MRELRVAAGLAALALATAVPAMAQVSIGADVGLNSAYVWRGLSLTNKPVIQPDVWLSAYGFTVGGWANVEPTKCDGANDLCESGYGSNLDGVGDAPRSGIAEIDYWVEYGRDFGNVSAKAGWIAFTYNKGNAVLDNTANTSELYGQISIGGMPVTPTFAIWYDIDNIKGAYMEGSLAYGIAASPAVSIDLKALAGLSAGQEVNSDPNSTESFNFFESGLTHVDFSASTSLTAGPISIAPALHFQVSIDEITRLNNAQDAADFINNGTKGPSSKIWFGVTLSWSKEFGAAASE